MNDQQYFLTTSLSYQLKAARRELADFHSGEIYQKLRADYEGIIRELKLTIKKLRSERDEFSFSCRKMTKQWMDVLDDIQKEHEQEIRVAYYTQGEDGKAESLSCGKFKNKKSDLFDMVSWQL